MLGYVAKEAGICIATEHGTLWSSRQSLDQDLEGPRFLQQVRQVRNYCTQRPYKAESYLEKFMLVVKVTQDYF